MHPLPLPVERVTPVGSLQEEGGFDEPILAGLSVDEPQPEVGAAFLLVSGRFGSAEGDGKDEFISPDLFGKN